MTAKMDQFQAINSNSVLSVAKDGVILYSNEAGEPLLHEWGVRVGDKLPPHIEIFVQRAISREGIEKIEVKVGRRVYFVVFQPLPEKECVNIYGFDISDRKELEGKLRESEAQEKVNLELAEIIDAKAVQSLMNDFYRLAHIPMALLDLKGNILVSVGWQEICIRFHRVNPETCKYCVESDINLTADVAPGGYKQYKCKNNMWDVVTPIIVEGQHIGNIFSGQFLFNDEPLDYELFRSQARKYGFNEEEYIAALEIVPRLSREAVDTGMAFFMTFANMISQLSYSNIKLSQSLVKRDELVDALMESEKREQARSDELEAVLDAVPVAVFITHDPRMRQLTGNRLSYEWLRVPVGTNFSKSAPEGERPEMFELFKDGKEIPPENMPSQMAAAGREVNNCELDIVSADGQIRHVLGNARPLLDKQGKTRGSVSAFIDITERKKMEKALRFSNLYNRSLIEASLDPLVTIGRNGKITDVNGATELITGYSRTELIGTDFSDYFTEPEKARAGYQQVFMHGEIRDYPLEIRHREGHITPVLYNASVYRDENGEVIGVFAAARDITAVKKAEEKIKTLANAVESSDDAIMTKSLDGIITSWNNGAKKVYGYLAEEVLGKCISILEPGNIEGETKNLIEKVKQGERVQHYETLRLKKDGTIINVSVTLSPVFDASGKLVAISTITRDITENKKAEEAIRLSNLYNRSLIEASLDPLVTIGRKGKITDVNGATEQVTGYSRNDLIGTDFSDYFTEPEKARAGYQQVFMDGEVRDYPLEIQHKDGHITPVLYNASVYRDKNGEVIGAFAAARDITERKRVEEALRESESRLRLAQVSAGAGIWDWNMYTDKLEWSEELFRLFGLDPGKSDASFDVWRSVLHPDDKLIAERRIETAIKNRTSLANEFRIVLQSGEVRWINALGNTTYDSNGKPQRMSGICIDITKRKEAEEALKITHDNLEKLVEERTIELEKAYTSLKESENSLAEAQRMAHIGNWEWDLVTGEVYWSEEMYRIFGLNPQQLSPNYEGFLNYVHPDDRDYVDNAITKALNEKPFGIDYRIITANGKELIVHAESEVIFDSNNIPVMAKGIVQDITERKKSEEKIRNLANIVESSNDAIGTVSLNGVITSWNKGAEQVYGYSAEEILGKPVSILAPPHLSEETKKLTGRVRKGERIHNYETSRLRKDGTIINVSITFSPVFDTSGKLTAVSVIARDITERKRAEEKLRESEEKYRNIVETANEGILIIDDEAVITYANKKMTDMLGYSLEEGIGRSVWDFVDEESKAIIKQNLEKRWQGINESYELKLICKNGSPLWALINAKSVFDNDGRFMGTVSMITDITERKKAEEALEKMDKVRIKEIHHRIKNNLQIISSLLDLQAEKFEDENVIEAFREGQNRVISMSLIHEELYKGEGTDTLDFSVYLKKLAENLFKTYNLSHKNISLSMDMEEDAFFDMDTAVPLGIIVNELVSNSLKHAFTEDEEGQIRIKLYREGKNIETNMSLFSLTVSDDGKGLPEDMELKCIESLGLQLVDILVDQLDGELELKRAHGTKFIIKFKVIEKR